MYIYTALSRIATHDAAVFCIEIYTLSIHMYIYTRLSRTATHGAAVPRDATWHHT